MPDKYAPTVNPGDTRMRVYELQTFNPLNGDGRVIFKEQEVIRTVDNNERVLTPQTRIINAVFKAGHTIAMRHPVTDEIIGTITHDEVRVALYSIARDAQLQDDERLANRDPHIPGR